jgi:hypothetical protein
MTGRAGQQLPGGLDRIFSLCEGTPWENLSNPRLWTMPSYEFTSVDDISMPMTGRRMRGKARHDATKTGIRSGAYKRSLRPPHTASKMSLMPKTQPVPAKRGGRGSNSRLGHGGY